MIRNEQIKAANTEPVPHFVAILDIHISRMHYSLPHNGVAIDHTASESSTAVLRLKRYSTNAPNYSALAIRQFSFELLLQIL